eukprot:gene6867-13915_t
MSHVCHSNSSSFLESKIVLSIVHSKCLWCQCLDTAQLGYLVSCKPVFFKLCCHHSKHSIAPQAPSIPLDILKDRYNNSSLPPITALYGPETIALASPVPLFSQAHNLPWVTAQCLHLVPRSFIYNTSFSVSPPIFYQHIELINAYLDKAVVILPFSARKAAFVYPIPTWNERVYNWELLEESEQQAALAIAVGCSIILLVIAITVTIYRAEPEILALIWQHDNTQPQCNAYMWVTYLSASFIVQLINIKAYRLSTFMRASATGRSPKPFKQMRVLRLTMMGLMLTVILYNPQL